MIKVFSTNLFRVAREYLIWMDCYRKYGNASLVCHKFGIARKSFSRRPKHSPR